MRLKWPLKLPTKLVMAITKIIFGGGSIGLGHILPLALMLTAVFLISSPILGVIAGLATGVGLYLYEYAFVMAPQEIPNS